MPNRLIKDSIHESEKVNALSDFQFRIWVNLITYVDDYGRGDARPAIIKGKCFPLRDRIANKDIEAALHALADTGCVGLYEVDGKPYLYFPNWESHQRVRKKISKYPAPPVDGKARQVAANGGNLRQMAADCGEVRPESNPNPNPESESESEVESGGGGTNPYADAGPRHPDFTTVEAYASSNLRNMTAYNMEELATFRDDLPEELIRHAIDEACGNGKPVYNYVRSILNRYVEQGFKTLGDVQAHENERQRKGGRNGVNRGNAGGNEYKPLPGETVV